MCRGDAATAGRAADGSCGPRRSLGRRSHRERQSATEDGHPTTLSRRHSPDMAGGLHNNGQVTRPDAVAVPPTPDFRWVDVAMVTGMCQYPERLPTQKNVAQNTASWRLGSPPGRFGPVPAVVALPQPPAGGAPSAPSSLPRPFPFGTGAPLRLARGGGGWCRRGRGGVLACRAGSTAGSGHAGGPPRRAAHVAVRRFSPKDYPRRARLTALIIAFREASTVLPSIPTPHSTLPSTAHSTYAAAWASPPSLSACSA